MILFKDDWLNYPNAIADTSTTNRSFVRIAALYKDMGVENHMFPLALLNPLLKGVNPHDPTLTLMQMTDIANECKANPFYFFREVLRVPPIAGGDAVSLMANRGNMALFWLFFNHITIILIQIRQTGKSVSVYGLSTLLLNLLCTHTSINLLTKDDVLRTETLSKLKEIDMELPFYLRQRSKSDICNTEELRISSLNNKYRAHVPQKQEKMAANLGRGLVSGIFHIDEGPFQSNISVSVPAALAAGSAARDMARQNNAPYGTIFTTTAGKRDDKDGAYIFSLLSKSAEWTEKLFDAKNLTELETIIRKNSRSGELRVNCTFNHKQLGKTDEWLKKTIEESLAVGEDADRDFFNVWTSGTLTSPLPVTVTEAMRASKMDPVYISISNPHSYITRWFIPESEIEYTMANSNFILGVDSSDASGGDDISLFITDIRTAETIAAGNYNETNLITFSEWLCSWFIKYPNITGIIERRSSGAMILDYLILMLPSKGIDPFRRLFNRAVNDYEEYGERWREINVPMGRRRQDSYVTYKKTFGFSTSGSGLTSRTELYSTTLQNAAKRSAGKIRDLTTIDQITGLTTRNGRVDHQVGGHDDMVIAWLLCFWLITQGKNLSYYGIDSKSILSETNKSVALEGRALYDFQKQQAVRAEIEDLYTKIKKETDEYLIQRLEYKLRVLNKSVVLEEGEIFSMDDLINSVRSQRSKRNQEVMRVSPDSYYNNYVK